MATMAGDVQQEQVASGEVGEDERVQRKKRVQSSLLGFALLSVLQHVAVLMTEPVLLRNLYKGDVAKTSVQLGNTRGLIGVLSIFFNQLGGSMSDCFGRRPFLLIGPLANIVNGVIMATWGMNSATAVLLSRTIKLPITTFSNTVMISAVIQDTMVGPEIGAFSGKIGGVTGIALILGNALEGFLLKVSNNNFRVPFAWFCVVGVIQVFWMALLYEETLPIEKRKKFSVSGLIKACNPFGFIEIYRSGTRRLQDLVTVTTSQWALEGKNASDLHQMWMANQIKATFVEGSQFQTCYGSASIVANLVLLPFLLQKLSPKNFTTLCNVGLAIAFGVLRGSHQKLVYFSFMFFALPGVNGASTTALKVLQTNEANALKYGVGEFNAWVSNLRAITCAIVPVLLARSYSWAIRTGRNPRVAWQLAALIGAVFPQIYMMLRLDVKPEVKDTKQ